MLMLPLVIVRAKEKLFRRHSEQQSQINILMFLLHTAKQGAAKIICTSSIFNDLMVMRRKISPLPIASASQGNHCVLHCFPNEKQAAVSKLDSRSKLLQSKAGLNISPLTGISGDICGEYFIEQKKEPGLSYTSLQGRASIVKGISQCHSLPLLRSRMAVGSIRSSLCPCLNRAHSCQM